MKRLSKTAIQLTALFLVFSAMLTITYAAYWIYSAMQSITITDYVLTLSVSATGREVTFTGALTQTGGIADKTVYIYHTDSSGNIQGTEISTATTQLDGSYQADYLEPSAGTYHYKAGVQIP